MGSCNSRSESFVKPVVSTSINSNKTKKSKLKKTLSFLDARHKFNSNKPTTNTLKTNLRHNSSNEFVFLNQLPKIELDLTKKQFNNFVSNNSLSNNSSNEIEEYDNAVLDYFTLLNSSSKDDIIYADDISYPFPTVILAEEKPTHLLTQTTKKNINNKATNSTSECSTSFVELAHMSHLKQRNLNTSTDNSLHTLSTSSASHPQNNFESSSSSSFIQSSKMQTNNSRFNRFGFKPAHQVGIPTTKMNITKSDSLSQNSSSISSSMPNSSSSNLPRAKSPFRSYLPRPPVATTNLKSHQSIPTSISNSISLASSTANTHTNMTRTVSTSGVSSNSKNNQSSSLSSLSSTTSSNLSQHLMPPSPQPKIVAPKKTNSSPTKSTKIIPFQNQLSSSKIQNTTPSPTSNHNNQVAANALNKRRLFSPYSLNIPSTLSNSSSPTNQTNITNNLNTSINSINLNQIYSSDINNNNITNTNHTKTNNNQTKLKPPSITTQQFKIINLNAKSSSNTNKTKMPIKSSSIKLLDQTSITYSHKSPVKQQQVLEITNGSLIKREDSAYCSSTSSTVSSQEAEINKINPIKDDEEVDNKNELNISEIKKLNKSEETDSEFNNEEEVEEDYIEDNLNTIDNLKQTIMNLDLKSSSNMLNLDQISELNFDITNKQQQENRNSVCNASKLKLSNRNSIRDSIGELSQLMSTSVSVASPVSDNSEKQQRRSSTTSLLNNQHHLFRPPSNLPPAENSEVIQIDIDTFRLIMQDIQNTKMILYKLANILREPQSINSSDNATNLFGDEFKPDDLHSLMTNNPLITSFYNYQSMCHNYDKIDQSTQTE